MGYGFNRLDKSVFMAVPKAMLTEFDIHYRLESCEPFCPCLITVIWNVFRCIRVQMHKNPRTYYSYLILGQMGASVWLGDAFAPRNGGHGSRALVGSAREVPPDERR